MKTMLWYAAILTLVTSGAAYSAEQNDVGATRPDPQGQRTEIRVGIYVFDVTSVDDVEETFTADVIVHLRWSDPRLAIDSVERRTIDLEEVWHPRIQIANERRVVRKFAEQVDEQVLLVRLVFPDYSEQELRIEVDREPLPTAAGVVWTDGAVAGLDIFFEAFGPGSTSLGTFGPFNFADAVNNGTTAEDRFFGASDAGGIESISVTNTGVFGGIEVDHVQFGVMVPEPSAFVLGAIGLLCVGW